MRLHGGNADDLVEEFIKMLNRTHYNIRQRRDGSDLTSEAVDKEILEAKKSKDEKLKDFLENLKRQQEGSLELLKKIQDSSGSTQDEKEKNYREDLTDKYYREQYKAAKGAGLDDASADSYAKERAKEEDERLKKVIKQTIDSFNEYPNVVRGGINASKKEFAKIAKSIRDDKFREQKNILSFGLQGRADQNIDNLSSYGNAMNGVGGRMQAYGRLGSMKFGGGGILSKAIGGLSKGLGGLGKVVSMTGGLFTKLAEPIGWLITALQLFGDAINAINEYEIEQLGFQKRGLEQKVQFDIKSLELTNEIKTEEINYRYDLLQRSFEVESEIARAAKELSANNYAKAVEISMGSITQGIAQTAFSAANAAIEAGHSSMVNANRATTAREKAEATNAVRGLKNSAKMENITQEMVSTMLEYENRMLEINQESAHNKEIHYLVSNAQDTTDGGLLKASEIASLGSGPTDEKGFSASEERYQEQERRGETKGLGEAAKDIGVNALKDISGTQESTHKLLEANLKYINYQEESAQSLNKLQIKNANEQKVLLADNETKLYNMKKDYDKSIYEIEANAAKKIAHEYLKLTQKEFDVFGKLDETMRNTGIGMGILDEGGLENYIESMSKRMPSIMRKWGVAFDDIAKIQTSYSENTGRSIILTDKDVERNLGLTMLTGDQSVTDELNSDMQIFTLSMSDSSQMFAEILADSSQLGLNMRKMGKNLVKDMKLANKYEFKGGVRGLGKMSEWASKVRFDMSNLPNLIDKYTNSLEDSITNSASIQVLGGNFAMNMGDPLKNSYLAAMDPEQLAKNQNEALKGIGYFDKTEGKTKIGIADQQRLKAYSEATGISMESLRAQVTQQVQGNEVLRNLTSERSEHYTDKQKELLQQVATRSENGEWEVTLHNGEKKNINDITESDFADLMPHEEAMYDLTKKGVECLETLVGKNKKLEGETNAEQIELFQRHTNEFYQTYDEMVVTAKKYFETHKSDFQTELSDNLKLVRESYKGYLQIAEEGNKEIDAKTKQIQKSANEIASTLQGVSQVFLDAKQRLEQSLAEGNSENVKKKANAKAEEVKTNAEQTYQQAKNKEGQSNISQLLNAVAKSDTGWFMRAGRKGSSESKVMEDLYKNYGKYEQIINNTKGYGNKEKNYAKVIISHFDPDGNIGSMHLSKEQEDRLEKLNKQYYEKEVKKLISTKTNITDSYVSRNSGNYSNNWSNDFLGEGTTIITPPKAKAKDGVINTDGRLDKIEDGFVVQNGIPTKIDDNDQVLAAKEGGPIARMLDMIQSISTIQNQTTTSSSYLKSNVSDKQNSNVSSAKLWESILDSSNNIIRNKEVINGAYNNMSVMSSNVSPQDEVIAQPNPMSYESHVMDLPHQTQANETNGKIDISPIKINLDGSFQLNGVNDSMDITQLIVNDPNFIRSLSQAISLEVEKKVRGGRVVNPLNRGLEF